MKHVMLDLETMGTRAGCAVVAIGAVEFDFASRTLGREFYQTIDLASCTKAGLTIDPNTVMWWLAQSEMARQALAHDTIFLSRALAEFTEWYNPEAIVWGHGADFDPPILDAAYGVLGLSTPWKRRNVLDTRTILWLVNQKMGSHQNGHHALADAKYQATRIMEVANDFGLLLHTAE